MNYTNLSTLKMSFMGIQVKKSLKQTETKKNPKTQKTEIMIHILHFINKLKPESASFDFSIEAYPHTCLIAYFCCNHSYKHNHNFRPSFGSENWLGMDQRSWYIRQHLQINNRQSVRTRQLVCKRKLTVEALCDKNYCCASSWRIKLIIKLFPRFLHSDQLSFV